MANDINERPFLQILHISDLHIMDSGFDYQSRDVDVQRYVQIFRNVNETLANQLKLSWEHGSTGHDESALKEFMKFLKTFSSHPSFLPSDAIWLVDTGDLSTFGDESSLALGHRWLRDFKAELHAPFVSLYGNHDAWPEHFPALGSRNVRNHREVFRRKWHRNPRPRPPLTVSIPGTESQVQLFSLNSVCHDVWRNSFARGEIIADPHWSTTLPKVSDQLQELARVAAHANGQNRNLRIIAVHHPIHDPDHQSNRLTMTLDNADLVAKTLKHHGHNGLSGSLAHMILSGHTHLLFPKFGRFSNDTPPHSKHLPLGGSQMQLIVGSLSQKVKSSLSMPPGDPSAQPHQFQLLRFWADTDQPFCVRIERALIARKNGTGPFDFIIPNGASKPWEETRLPY